MGSFRRVALVATLAALVLPAAGAADGETLIVFFRDGGISVVRPDGSGLTDLGGGVSPSWSPEGARLAYLDGGNDVWVLDRSSGTRTRITATAATEGPPVWSPDGTQLAFVSLPQGADAGELDAAAANGSSSRRLAADVSRLSIAPSWSPDGRDVAYTARAGSSGSDVALARSDGSGTRRLTDDASQDLAPVWAPAAQTLAFLRLVPGASEYTVHVIAADGTGLRRVSSTPAAVGDGVWGSWSPDGHRIAFSDHRLLRYEPRGGAIFTSDVRVVDVADGGERTLTDGGGATRPAWSPDGSRMAFGGVVVMNADGTCETLVARGLLGVGPWHGPSGPPLPALRCADLRLSVVQNRTEVARGEEARFELTVADLETETATGVRLEVDAPSGGSLTSLTADRGSCSASACELGTLAVGEAAKVTAVLRADGTGSVSARALVHANEPDGSRADNEAKLIFQALPCTLVGTWGGDRLVGTPASDVVCARPGPDLILGLAGADVIDAGNGDDVVFPGPGADRVDLRGGRDVVDARDGARDVITCGGEADVALVDRFDRADKECEVVSRTTLLCRSANSVLFRGSFRADVLVGNADRRRRDSLCGFSGNDTLIGLAGDDALDGGSGNDTLKPGSGRDLVLGGAGYDTIEARDGERDRIRCGTEDDVVLADRVDRVAADCERVRLVRP
jgi:Ca2+-binding RTX toxin-like protein